MHIHIFKKWHGYVCFEVLTRDVYARKAQHSERRFGVDLVLSPYTLVALTGGLHGADARLLYWNRASLFFRVILRRL